MTAARERAASAGDVRAGTAAERDLVLVGGGHTHVQVLRRWMMRRVPGVRLTVVLDRPEAVYSGMVPGLVAGDYRVHELEIDVVPLARRAGARVILSAATGVDTVQRRIRLKDRPAISYDVASLDVGSTVRGLDLPGVREYTIPTRPIRELVDRLEHNFGDQGSAGAVSRVAIVGGGAAGVELAFTVGARLRSLGGAPEVTLVCETPDVMSRYPDSVRRRLRREAEAHGIGVRGNVRVEAVEKGALLTDGDTIEADWILWATGAAPLEFLGSGDLPLDPAGFIRTDDTLQVEGAPGLFAAGDCASLTSHPWVPKAGVYAVRQGPVLDTNLRASLAGGSLTAYRPQRDFLTLVNLGQGRALGAKWGLVSVGRATWQLKDTIDRRFMRRFQVLEPDGALASDFPDPDSMGMEEMACGGCAAKLGASVLERALGRLEAPLEDASVVLGLAQPDDAAGWLGKGGEVVLATVDAFRSFTDDPWLVGRVAAINAASDVLAKGGRPRHALALVTVPEERDERAEETLFQVLSGVRAALDPLDIVLVGGHTTTGDELFVGLTITGEAESVASLWKNDTARAGDALILTRSLGTGVIWAADMQGRAAGAWVRAVRDTMLRSNGPAAEVARRVGVNACTDISGFGLAGHLSELLRASDVAATLDLAALPAYDGALSLFQRGLRSTYHEQNAVGRRGIAREGVSENDPRLELLFDPQTSGGLLFSLPVERVSIALDALQRAGDSSARRIGNVVSAREDGVRITVGPGGRDAPEGIGSRP